MLQRSEHVYIPDLGVRLQAEPVGKRAVLLLLLSELDLGTESLVGRLNCAEHDVD